MLVEIFCLLCLFQDVRNTTQASIISGTAADKAKKTSQFFKSGLRRTQVGEAKLNSVLFEALSKALITDCRSLQSKLWPARRSPGAVPDRD